MRGQHDGDALVAQLAHELPHGVARLRVHPRARLVEEHDLRAADDGRGEGQALALAAGQAPHGRARERREPESLGELGERARLGVHAGHVLQHLGRRDPGGQPAVLQHHADAGSQRGRVLVRVEAEHANGSAVGLAQPFAALDRRRLAGSVAAEHGGDGPGVGDEVEAVDDSTVAVTLDEARHLHGAGEDVGCRHGRAV